MTPKNHAPQALVEASGVGKAFGDNIVLDSVDFSVFPGERIGLIGASGCGKSTLLKCVNFIVEYDQGAIRVGGELVGYQENGDGRRVRASEKNLTSLRRKVGMVFQSYNLFPHLTVMQNLTKAPLLTGLMTSDAANEKAVASLKTIGLSDKADVFPSSLSGGQQQRVAIMRALMMSPEVMLFDEITSALDPSLVGEVLGLLSDLAKDGLTMMIVSHELAFLDRVADRILFLHKGRIHEDGSPDEILRNPRTPELKSFLAGFYN